MRVTITKSDIGGSMRIPASKSHTIRALIIATLARGESRILYPLESSDTRSCLEICKKFGAVITEKENEWVVQGTAGKPMIPDDVLDTGNSGTTLYLAAGSAALIAGASVFTGDEQIRRRPIDNLLAALGDLGAQAYSTRNNGCAPVVIQGPLRGGKTAIRCPTSQYLSSLLINCPLGQGDTEIQVLELNEKPYVAITLDWLRRQNIAIEHDDALTHFIIKGNQKYMAFTREMPGDFSSATFFLCLAAVTGACLVLDGLDMSDPQGDKAVVSMLEKMGAKVTVRDNAIEITGKKLVGARLDLNATPDALPALAVTACFAHGVTELVNVAQARLKETDRISVMRKELEKMGARIRELPDGLVIEGAPLCGANVHGHGDHRVVMALAVAGLASKGKTTIDTAEAAAVTFPEFFTLIESIKQ